MTKSTVLLGIDVGGTFTDAIAIDAESGTLLAAFKLPSIPADPAVAVVTAVDRIAEIIPVTGAVVCHGTTVGTNTLIERKGACTALLATTGFTDVVALRRQDRPILYGFNVRISEPLVPSERRIGVQERIGADGEIVESLRTEGLVEKLARAGVESIAISFLHSYVNDKHEQDVCAVLQAAMPSVFITRSSDVCPEFREYERTSTAVVNAYIGPSVSKYVTALDKALRDRGIGRLMIVKSNGGLTSPQNASRYPVHLIESGPAAQLTAAAAFASATGRQNLVAFDMGGTTAKAGVIRNGEPEMISEFYADRLVDGREVGGYAIRSNVLDLVEIGAGGGSIAWIDEGNVLKVGPQSAGADPGPACYGRGGTLPTVTDAHAVIGTLSPELFADSGVKFDRAAAVHAVQSHVADKYRWTVARAAYAIIDIAVANMAQMVRLATTQRGLDPRDFALLASGGAGPLHATAVGSEIGTSEVIIPPFPGMFSALGATLGAVRHEVTQTLLKPLHDLETSALLDAFARLAVRAEELLANEPAGIKVRRERFVEARFAGQLFELRVPVGRDDAALPSTDGIERGFRSVYVDEYGFDLPDAKIQAVNLRLVVTVELGRPADKVFRPSGAKAGKSTPFRTTQLIGRDGNLLSVPVYRADEVSGDAINGPAIVEHAGATVWMQAGQTAITSPGGQMVVKLSGGCAA